MILHTDDRVRIDLWATPAGNPLQGSLTIYGPDEEWRTAIVMPAAPFQTIQEFCFALGEELFRHLDSLPVQLPLFEVNIIEKQQPSHLTLAPTPEV